MGIVIVQYIANGFSQLDDSHWLLNKGFNAKGMGLVKIQGVGENNEA